MRSGSGLKSVSRFDTTLFLTAVHKPMGKRAVQLMLQRYLAEAGIENASLQTLGQTMAVITSLVVVMLSSS